MDEKVVTSNTITLESILPVTLINFTGNETADGNALSWATLTETNSRHFELEKAYNSTQFQAIAVIDAAGNSSSSRFYNYLDVKPLKGDNFYRLKMVDRDGTFKYSKVVLINNKNEYSGIRLYNNPTRRNGISSLIITNGERGNSEVIISNLSGQVVKTLRVSNTTGTQQMDLDATGLAAGIYIITYRSSEGKVLDSIKWMIIR